jgi:hypothetical protein
MQYIIDPGRPGRVRVASGSRPGRVAGFSIGVAGFSIGDSWHRGGVAGFSIGCCGARPQPPLLAPAAAATRAHRWPTMIWYRCRARYEAEAP